jgi:hypothetical protein
VVANGSLGKWKVNEFCPRISISAYSPQGILFIMYPLVTALAAGDSWNEE